MSENSISIRTQPPLHLGNVSFDSEGQTILPHGVSLAEAAVKKKPRFAEFICSYTEVGCIRKFGCLCVD